MSNDEELRTQLERIRAASKELEHQLGLVRGDAEHWRLNYAAAGNECLRLRKLRQQILDQADSLPAEIVETAKALTPVLGPVKLDSDSGADNI